MSEYRCENCTHFYQHYTLRENRIFRVYCGHCPKPRMKKRTPDAKICEHFELAEHDESEFVSKEYLGKTLLDRLMSLELFPEIEDSPQ